MVIEPPHPFEGGAPGSMLLGAVVAHLAYGLTLTLSLKVAGTDAAAAA